MSLTSLCFLMSQADQYASHNIIGQNHNIQYVIYCLQQAHGVWVNHVGLSGISTWCGLVLVYVAHWTRCRLICVGKCQHIMRQSNRPVQTVLRRKLQVPQVGLMSMLDLKHYLYCTSTATNNWPINLLINQRSQSHMGFSTSCADLYKTWNHNKCRSTHKVLIWDILPEKIEGSMFARDSTHSFW